MNIRALRALTDLCLIESTTGSAPPKLATRAKERDTADLAAFAHHICPPNLLNSALDGDD